MAHVFQARAEKILHQLEWDSTHFGFPVAQVASPELDDVSLNWVLDRARKRGIRLVYWPAAGGRSVPSVLLKRYRGVLVDRKAVFERDLGPTDAEPTGSEGQVRHFPAGLAPDELVELALAAGTYSRFAMDPAIPRERFIALYRTWIDRCTRGEMAGAVLVAGPEGHSAAGGMITLSVEGTLGRIGLIAVRKELRGQGVGRRLMAGGHRWLAGRGAERVEVVTQLANTPACSLYERCEYQLREVHFFYHFWVQAEDPQAAAA